MREQKNVKKQGNTGVNPPDDQQLPMFNIGQSVPTPSSEFDPDAACVLPVVVGNESTDPVDVAFASGEPTTTTPDAIDRPEFETTAIDDEPLKEEDADRLQVGSTAIVNPAVDVPVENAHLPINLPFEESRIPDPGTMFFAACGSLSIAADNPWGCDVVEDEQFRRVGFVANSPVDLEPMLVVRAGNGWLIVGNPLAFLVIEKNHPLPIDRAAIMLPVREIIGTGDVVIYHVAARRSAAVSFAASVVRASRCACARWKVTRARRSQLSSAFMQAAQPET